MKLVALNHAPKYSAAATIRRNATQRRMITSPTRKQLASVPLRIPRATSPGDKEKEPVEDDKDFVGLDPEDDYEIPGNYRDAMSGNTQLGKAIREACSELDTLAALEMETLTEADALLKKLGLKTSIFDVDSPSG